MIEHFLSTFAALFAIVNPFSTLPLFLSLTGCMSDAHRQQQATKTALLAAIIMLVVLFIGAATLHLFGISIAALRIAGGMIVAYIGFRMLFPAQTPTNTDLARADESQLDYAFMPLAFPSLAGAGAMAAIMSAATHAHSTSTIAHRVGAYALIVLSILTVCAITWIMLRFSTRLSRFLGKSGLDALTRVMGLLLVCIGVQFVATGVRAFATE